MHWSGWLLGNISKIQYKPFLSDDHLYISVIHFVVLPDFLSPWQLVFKCVTRELIFSLSPLILMNVLSGPARLDKLYWFHGIGLNSYSIS